MAPTPGWYDDPAGGNRLRWWDGDAWTQRTRPHPPSDEAAPTPTPEPEPAAEPDAGSTPGSGEAAGPQESTTGAGLFGTTSDEPTSRLAATVPAGADAPTPLLPLDELYSRGDLPEGGDRVVEIPGADGPRSNRTPLFVAGVLLLMIGVVAGVALTRQSGNVFALEVGDCFDDLTDAGTGGVSDVPTVSCEEPHGNEVFAIHSLDEYDAFPGAATLEALVATACVDSFRDVVGYPLELTDLDVSAIRPTQTTWNSGDREMVCFLERADGGQLVGSRIGMADGEGRAVFRLQVGDCFDAPLADAEVGSEVTGVSVVDCALPHYGQVYEVAELDQGAYPGRAELVSTAQVLCADALTTLLGQAWETSSLYYNALPPTESSWDAGDREVICYAYDPINGPMVGEAREWDRQQVDAEFGEGYDVSGLAVGDCFDDPPTDGGTPEGTPVATLSCAEPHDNEVFFTFDLDADAWPGADRLTATVDERCAPAFEEYVGSDRVDLTWFAFQPTLQTFEDGDRRVVCALYDVDFLKIRGSQRRAPV